MNECIFCGSPCRGEVCEECIEEFGDIVDLPILNRLAHSVSCRESGRLDREAMEELEEE